MNESVSTSSDKAVLLEKLKLPTISKQGMKALDIINAEDLKMDELESALSADPMLMGILLKYANSPIYGMHFEVKNIRNAINLLGIEIVKSAILICTMRSFCESENVANEMLWQKSVNLSIMTRLIARKLYRKLANEIEVSAMMSQIGGLVLSSNFEKDYLSVVEKSIEKLTSIETEEFERFGLQRSDVTAFALEKLRLPNDVINALTLFYQGDIPIEIKSITDKHTVSLMLASLLIDYNNEKSEKNASILSLMDKLELVDSDIDGFIDIYEEKVSEGFAF